MWKIGIFFRRIAGGFRAIFGRRRARRILKELRKVDLSAYAIRIVSDAALMNGIPSPSESEKLRMEFVSRRLGEFGISNVTTDEYGNIVALFPAFGARRDFLLVLAEVGDADFDQLESSVHLTEEKAKGKGFGERSLGAAALLVFAEYARITGFHLEKNLMILFTKSGSIDESGEALNGFLKVWADRISCAVLVRGQGLGVIESRQVGSYKLAVQVTTPRRELFDPSPKISAAVILGSIAVQVGGIASDVQQRSTVSIARMEAGAGYGHWSTEGGMDIEIISEDQTMLETLKNIVAGTITRASTGAEATIAMSVRSHHSIGDSLRNAPMTDSLRSILAKLKLKPEIGIISEKISMLNEHGIPATVVGMSQARLGEDEDWVELGNLTNGFRQLLLLVESCASTIRKREG